MSCLRPAPPTRSSIFRDDNNRTLKKKGMFESGFPYPTAVGRGPASTSRHLAKFRLVVRGRKTSLSIPIGQMSCPLPHSLSLAEDPENFQLGRKEASLISWVDKTWPNVRKHSFQLCPKSFYQNLFKVDSLLLAYAKIECYFGVWMQILIGHVLMKKKRDSQTKPDNEDLGSQWICEQLCKIEHLYTLLSHVKMEDNRPGGWAYEKLYFLWVSIKYEFLLAIFYQTKIFKRAMKFCVS